MWITSDKRRIGYSSSIHLPKHSRAVRVVPHDIRKSTAKIITCSCHAPIKISADHRRLDHLWSIHVPHDDVPVCIVSPQDTVVLVVPKEISSTDDTPVEVAANDALSLTVRQRHDDIAGIDVALKNISIAV